MEHYELRLLADYIGNPLGPLGPPQVANTWARPTPAAVGGELENNERGEIVFAEIWSPLDIAFNDEDLRKVTIVVDGHDTGSYVSLSGIRTTTMAPPKDRIWNGKLYSLGTPRSNNPLLNTTLKYKHDVTVACLAGPTPAGITGTYRVRLWGYVYKDTELPAVFGTMLFPAYVTESARSRTVTLVKDPIPVSADTWLLLPGGKDQSVPKINPFARFAYNLLATDGLQGDYQFRFTNGGVLDEQENLYFEFDDKDALIVEGLGVQPANDLLTLGTLARTGLRIAGDYHPKGPTTRQSLFPTDINSNTRAYGLWPINPIVFGFPIPAVVDVFSAIPKLDRPSLIWSEIGMVVVRDDGTAPVAVNNIVVALTGIRLEMRG
jgi:hypothetical protein